MPSMHKAKVLSESSFLVIVGAHYIMEAWIGKLRKTHSDFFKNLSVSTCVLECATWF